MIIVRVGEQAPCLLERKVVGAKMLYKWKVKASGEVKCYKARFVAKGFLQVEGIGYIDKYASTPAAASSRMLLATAASVDMELHHVDVKQGFIQTDVEEGVYIEQPEKYIDFSGGGRQSSTSSLWVGTSVKKLELSDNGNFEEPRCCVNPQPIRAF